MFKHGNISTSVAKGPFYFTLISFLTSVIVSAVLFIKAGNNYLAIFAAVMMLIVGLCSFAVLFGLLSDYAYIEDNVLHMNYLFKKSSISLKDIRRVELKDDVYHVYDIKNNEAGTINAQALGIDLIVLELDRNNVSFN